MSRINNKKIKSFVQKQIFDENPNFGIFHPKKFLELEFFVYFNQQKQKIKSSRF